MNVFYRCIVLAGLTAALLMPAAAFADELEKLAADANSAEGMPPTIPHGIKDSADGKECLACHGPDRKVKGASVTSHPERLTCTGCHIPANPGAPVKELKKGKKQK